MKKQGILLITLYYGLVGFAQQEILVTKNNTVTLIFPSTVSNHTLGDILEYIVYERDKNESSPLEQRILRLGYNIRGRGKTKTNLSVTTTDGLLYQFMVSYTDSMPKLTYQFSKEDAVADLGETKTPTPVAVGKPPIGATTVVQTPTSLATEGTQTKSFDIEKMQDIDPATVVNDNLYQQDKEAYIYLQCKNSLFRKKNIARTFSKAYNVWLRLKSVNYDKDELYIYLTLENDAAQAYDVDFIKFSITTKSKRKSISQEPPHIPPYIFNCPKRVLGKKENHFVVVFDKFPLSKGKELWIAIREKNGDRNLLLKLNHAIINNPRKF